MTETTTEPTRTPSVLDWRIRLTKHLKSRTPEKDTAKAAILAAAGFPTGKVTLGKIDKGATYAEANLIDKGATYAEANLLVKLERGRHKPWSDQGRWRVRLSDGVAELRIEVPEPVKSEQRICFGLAWHATEEAAELHAEHNLRHGIEVNGGYFHGMPCVRSKEFDVKAAGDQVALFACRT